MVPFDFDYFHYCYFSYQTLFVKKITFFFTYNSSLLWPNFIKKKNFFYKTLRGTIPFEDFLLSISRIIVFFYISYDNLSLFSPNVMKCLCNVKIVLGKFTFDFDDFYICCSNTLLKPTLFFKFHNWWEDNMCILKSWHRCLLIKIYVCRIYK